MGSVENASLLPWLTGTRFCIGDDQEKRGMMKVWNVWLVFLTSCCAPRDAAQEVACEFGPLFAQSSIGNWFVVFC